CATLALRVSRRPPSSTPSPYTTLFRSDVDVDRTDGMIRVETERGREVQYEIDVPVRMAVDVEGTNQSVRIDNVMAPISVESVNRSEEHTSELQSRENLVCRLLLEKKKK